MIITKWRPVDHYFPNATVSYYDITGSTAEELRAQLNLLRPADANGDRWDAVYRWSINWDWPGRGHSPCQLDKAIVTYKIKVIFPRWIPPKNASPELVTKWEAYTHALAEHEKEHVDYIVNNHQIVANAIKSADCYTAKSAAKAAIELLKQHGTEYDAVTDHGATQGARFP
jgi:predicted secreted Zn-dependent protease